MIIQNIGLLGSGGIPWNMPSFKYSGKSFDPSTQDSDAFSLSFKTDGTKLYIAGNNNNTVYQYSLSTAWDLSTASYDSKSFSVSSEETFPTGLSFKTDGTKMYVMGTFNDNINQYSLSTPWDVSTASFDSKTHNVGSEETVPEGLYIKPDGTKFYIIGTINDTIYQYSMSSAWDISTGSYDSKSYGVGLSIPTGLFFKDDGTKMYVLDDTTDKVHQYSLSTPWDVSTGSIDSKTNDVSGEDSQPLDLFIGDSGTKFYIVGGANNEIFQYNI
jgi:sugar lactone lactonase YvrE